MRGSRFDALSRSIASQSSRRVFFSTIFAGGTTGFMSSKAAQAQTCMTSGAPLPDSCQSTQYSCCSGYCEIERNVCCTPLGGVCTSDAECCGNIPSTAVGEAYYGCDVESFTCILGVRVASPEPTGPAQPPPPDDVAGQPPVSPQDLPSLIASIAQARTVAYGVVGIVKQAYTTSDPAFAQAQMSYALAQGSFDGWVAGLQFDLVQGTDPDTAMSRSQAQLESALTSASSFVQEFGVNMVSGGGGQSVAQVPPDSGEVTGGGGWDVFITLIPVAAPIIKDLFNGWRTMQKEQRDEIIAQFEALRWLPWSNVPG